MWFVPCLLLASQPFRLEIVDRDGWPVPLIELRTTHHVRLVSDNAGLIACDLPELMGRETWFEVIGHGYEVPKDGFGFRGVRLIPRPGEKHKLVVERAIIARRIGRLTGSGRFAEAQKLGEEKEWRDAPLVGCDSIHGAEFGRRMFWLWGDTTLARYPLGVFHTTAATSARRPLADVKPPLKIRYDHFLDDKISPRGVAKMEGSGPTWLTALTTVRDKDATEHLVASYCKIKPPLEAYRWGLCAWDGKSFQPVREVWTKSDKTTKPPPLPEGHACHWNDDRGKEWVLFGNPLPRLRCPATYEGWLDAKSWEVLTPQASLKDPSGADVKPHSGSIAYHPWRKRWVTVFMQHFGKPSVFGELWYAEADSPLGPWGTAVKVLTHTNYTFYNPRVHGEWLTATSPTLFFEGTYTAEFADRPPPTPRYDYNQMLYRLDVDDPRLAPARGKK